MTFFIRIDGKICVRTWYTGFNVLVSDMDMRRCGCWGHTKVKENDD